MSSEGSSGGYAMGRCPGTGIQPIQGGCFNCPLIWIFLIYSAFRYFSANSRKGSFCLFRLAGFYSVPTLKNPKEGAGENVKLRYSFLLSLLPCSKLYLILFLSLFRIKAVIIHFLCCDNPFPKCPGSII